MKARQSSPHAHQRSTTGQLMLQVVLACVPGTAALLSFFGWGVLFNLLWLSCLAVVLEAAVLKMRGRSMSTGLRDYSAMVTAVLLALALPPTAPWWLGATAIFFAIVVGKHLYGGLGYNPFNPAMVGYAIVLIGFPVEMTRWLLPAGISAALPDFSTSLTMFLDQEVLQGIDAYTGATTLDAFRQQQGAQLLSEFWQSSSVMGRWSGFGWEWINTGFLFGGLYLLYKRIISWHIPVSVLLSLSVLALFFNDAGSSQSQGSPLLHLFAGATMLGAFFIATDPVTAAATARGKLIYGTLIGTLIFVIRAFGQYPDGVAFAVLTANFVAPFIDLCTRPRTFGHSR